MVKSTQTLVVVAMGSLALVGCTCGELGGGGAAPLLVSGEIGADTLWPTSAGDCDVVVDGVVSVKATLTLAAGVKVCFGPKAGLLIQDTGALVAAGTAANHITLTGSEAIRGFWKGVGVLSNNSSNALQYVDLRFAGSDAELCCAFFLESEQVKASVIVGNNAGSGTLSMQHTTISESGNQGLFAFDGSRLPGFANNTFRDNTGAPVGLSLAGVNELDATSTFGGGNGKNLVRVLNFSNTTVPVTMRALDVPYAMSEGVAGQTFRVEGALTLNPGARLEFEENGGLIIEATGRLTSVGSGANRVVLTGRAATSGFWKGVGLLSLNNALTATDLTFAGNDEALCCGFFEPTEGGPSTRAGLVVGDTATQASAVVTDLKVTQSKHRGVSVLNGTLTQMGTNDLTTGNLQSNLLP